MQFVALDSWNTANAELRGRGKLSRHICPRRGDTFVLNF